MGKKRKMPGLNTSSTADISFMLLIFFLVTTSMDTDQGLARTLPKPPEDEDAKNELKVKERNILNIRINKDNYLMIGDDYVGLDEVKPRAKEFIAHGDTQPRHLSSDRPWNKLWRIFPGARPISSCLQRTS